MTDLLWFLVVLSVCAVVVGLTWHYITLKRAGVVAALDEAIFALRAARLDLMVERGEVPKDFTIANTFYPQDAKRDLAWTVRYGKRFGS